MRDAPPVCPVCATANPVPIIYGFPSSDTAREAEAERIQLGGCVVGDDDPRWKCRTCGHRWR